MTESVERRVEIIGVPLDLGQTERGTDVGPAALRYAGLRERLVSNGHAVRDGGNLIVPPSAAIDPGDRAQVIAHVNLELRDRASYVHESGAVPLVLGGDHSVAIGSVAASTRNGDTGILWVDAHADFNTPETSLSGNVHGMPLAVILGRGDASLLSVGAPWSRPRPEDVVIVGVRQLDPGERQSLRDAGLRVFSMSDVSERGISAVATEALTLLAHKPRLHVSFDVDSLDPRDAPGVGTPVRGGLTFREASLLMEKVASSGRLAAMDVVEVNPMLDHKNRTAETAVDLVLSALGERVY